VRGDRFAVVDIELRRCLYSTTRDLHYNTCIAMPGSQLPIFYRRRLRPTAPTKATMTAMP
jgi:hypothetical protein